MKYKQELGTTIKDILDRIEKNKIVVPDFQRDYVWLKNKKCDKIEALFDSLMKGFPIGNILSWEIDNPQNQNLRLNGILRYYQDSIHTQCPPINNLSNCVEAVIDGQQRLTSLFIGLKGYYETKVGYSNTLNSYIRKYLHICLSSNYINDSDHNFKFLTHQEVKASPYAWFKVSDILKFSDLYAIIRWLGLNNLDKLNKNEYPQAIETLGRLFDVVNKDPLIYTLKYTEQNYSELLEIFIRLNNNGISLKNIDLIISTIKASWTKCQQGLFNDFKNRIKQNCKIEIDDKLIVRGFMILHSNDVKLSLEHLTPQIINQFENDWDDYTKKLENTILTIHSWGFHNDSLKSKNSIIPIFYYLVKNNKFDNTNNLSLLQQDDENEIKKWLCSSLLNGIFGGEADGILRKIINIIRDAITNNTPIFPRKTILTALIGHTKTICYNFDKVEKWLEYKIDDNRAKALIILLFGNYERLGHKADFIYRNTNAVYNFRLRYPNQPTNQKPEDWVTSINNPVSLSENLLPPTWRPSDYSTLNFNLFKEERKKLIHEKLQKLLS